MAVIDVMAKQTMDIGIYEPRKAWGCLTKVKEVQMFEVALPCPCGKGGELVYTGDSTTPSCGTAFYFHRCTVCGNAVKIKNSTFPHQKFVRLEHIDDFMTSNNGGARAGSEGGKLA